MFKIIVAQLMFLTFAWSSSLIMGASMERKDLLRKTQKINRLLADKETSIPSSIPQTCPHYEKYNLSPGDKQYFSIKGRNCIVTISCRENEELKLEIDELQGVLQVAAGADARETTVYNFVAPKKAALTSRYNRITLPYGMAKFVITATQTQTPGWLLPIIVVVSVLSALIVVVAVYLIWKWNLRCCAPSTKSNQQGAEYSSSDQQYKEYLMKLGVKINWVIKVSREKWEMIRRIIASYSDLSYETKLNELEQKNCSICLCDFSISESIRKLNCKHIFHSKCIMEWVCANEESKATCPLCMMNLDRLNTDRPLQQV